MKTVLSSLNEGLKEAMRKDPRVFLLGEDVLDPYGGAFKVTNGLSSQFPERVITTPLSEAGFVGVGIGMAMRGLRPVVEIMFGDFVTLIADQIVNHASKFRWMYNEQVNVPLVIRTPMGGRRGYGPTHSQSLEKLFLGTPGIRMLAPNRFQNPGNLLQDAILNNQDPLLFIENKLLYAQPLADIASETEFEIIPLENPNHSESSANNTRHSHKSGTEPWIKLQLRGTPPASITMITYSYMAEIARQAAISLAYDYEIFSEILITNTLLPYNVHPILASVQSTHKVLTIEEGTFTMGWGAEILARLSEALGNQLHKTKRIAALDLPIPASGVLEEVILPNKENIVQTVRKMV